MFVFVSTVNDVPDGDVVVLPAVSPPVLYTRRERVDCNLRVLLDRDADADRRGTEVEVLADARLSVRTSQGVGQQGVNPALTSWPMSMSETPRHACRR